MSKVATYRLQLQPKFGFDQAREIVSYLKELGVSHIYTSPYLQAVRGSTHGYDVVGHSKVNEELGGTEAHRKLCTNIIDSGLQHMIDVVPNHMAIAGEQNQWWWDVLENGAASLYANYFDVDWENSEERWQNRILLPVLGDHYGRVLESGELKIEHFNSSFHLHYFDHKFPIDPSSLSLILRPAAQAVNSDILGFLAESYDRIPKALSIQSHEVSKKRHRDKAVLHTLLTRACHEDPSLESAIHNQVELINRDFDKLDKLIDVQNYRLAYWKVASTDLGYRRFFDISDLAGMRIENENVFWDTHTLIIDWVNKHWVHGLRIDHSDGLRNPNKYFKRLRRECPDAWIVTEKILEYGEALRSTWPIQGTTGYDFLGLCTRVLTHPDGEEPLKHVFVQFTGEIANIDDMILEAKQEIIANLLQSEINRLTVLFVKICENRRRKRDFSRSDLYQALTAVATHFDVYRTYFTPEEKPEPEDLEQVRLATTKAKEDHPNIDPELLDFLKTILCMENDGELELELAMRFQQLTGPVMAKGVEDTTFYRYNVLIGHNEVGNSPKHFSSDLNEFHCFMKDTQNLRPNTLLTLTTHDTKRSEDARARSLVLAEIPAQWHSTVLSWAKLSAQLPGDTLPNDVQYFIYQTLAATWPISKERLTEYFQKAFREAKRHTSWTAPNEAFERRVNTFLENLFASEAFILSIDAFSERIAVAGYLNSLTQTFIKLSAPGVPDIYQGCELWDFSLVDPDNRRLVDYDVRQQYLEAVQSMSLEQIMTRLAEGLPKLWLTVRLLLAKREFSESFSADSQYTPVYASGALSDHVIAYQRGSDVLCIASRFPLSRPQGWQDTTLPLASGRWQNYLSGDLLSGTETQLSDLLRELPVAILVRTE